MSCRIDVPGESVARYQRHTPSQSAKTRQGACGSKPNANQAYDLSGASLPPRARASRGWRLPSRRGYGARRPRDAGEQNRNQLVGVVSLAAAPRTLPKSQYGARIAFVSGRSRFGLTRIARAPHRWLQFRAPLIRASRQHPSPRSSKRHDSYPRPIAAPPTTDGRFITTNPARSR